MKALFCSTLMLLASAGPIAAPASDRIAGEYVEARTASVFAGACHYNGELVTTGRDAVMAWNFTSGMWQGVDLRGVRVMAAIASEKNLDEDAGRTAELIIDSAATPAQASAVASLFREKYAQQLGRIARVSRATVTFSRVDAGYAVKAAGIAEMAVQPMPDNACCKQPHLVWYAPVVPLNDRKVGFARKVAYSGSIGDPWQRAGENSAFYGSFRF